VGVRGETVPRYCWDYVGFVSKRAEYSHLYRQPSDYTLKLVSGDIIINK